MDHYRAYRIHRTPRGIEAWLEDLSSRAPVPGEVVIEASYSSINYKDALAVTGTGPWRGAWVAHPLRLTWREHRVCGLSGRHRAEYDGYAFDPARCQPLGYQL